MTRIEMLLQNIEGDIEFDSATLLPIIPCNIHLQKNENCHFYVNVTWLELRKVMNRFDYGGPALRVKLIGGLSWKMGSMSIQRFSEDLWKTIDAGMVYLTNKRIIFMGPLGNKSIPLKKILNFNAFENGIDIQRESGKSPFMIFSEPDVSIFSLILSKLIIASE